MVISYLAVLGLLTPVFPTDTDSEIDTLSEQLLARLARQEARPCPAPLLGHPVAENRTADGGAKLEAWLRSPEVKACEKARKCVPFDEVTFELKTDTRQYAAALDACARIIPGLRALNRATTNCTYGPATYDIEVAFSNVMFTLRDEVKRLIKVGKGEDAIWLTLEVARAVQLQERRGFLVDVAFCRVFLALLVREVMNLAPTPESLSALRATLRRLTDDRLPMSTVIDGEWLFMTGLHAHRVDPTLAPGRFVTPPNFDDLPDEVTGPDLHLERLGGSAEELEGLTWWASDQRMQRLSAAAAAAPDTPEGLHDALLPLSVPLFDYSTVIVPGPIAIALALVGDGFLVRWQLTQPRITSWSNLLARSAQHEFVEATLLLKWDMLAEGHCIERSIPNGQVTYDDAAKGVHIRPDDWIKSKDSWFFPCELREAAK